MKVSQNKSKGGNLWRPDWQLLYLVFRKSGEISDSSDVLRVHHVTKTTTPSGRSKGRQYLFHGCCTLHQVRVYTFFLWWRWCWRFLLKKSQNIKLILSSSNPVHTMPVRNETVTKLLRLGIALTRYEHGKTVNANRKPLTRNDTMSVLCEQLQHRDDFMPVQVSYWYRMNEVILNYTP